MLYKRREIDLQVYEDDGTTFLMWTVYTVLFFLDLLTWSWTNLILPINCPYNLIDYIKMCCSCIEIIIQMEMVKVLKST